MDDKDIVNIIVWNDVGEARMFSSASPFDEIVNNIESVMAGFSDCAKISTFNGMIFLHRNYLTKAFVDVSKQLR